MTSIFVHTTASILAEDQQNIRPSGTNNHVHHFQSHLNPPLSPVWTPATCFPHVITPKWLTGLATGWFSIWGTEESRCCRCCSELAGRAWLAVGLSSVGTLELQGPFRWFLCLWWDELILLTYLIYSSNVCKKPRVRHVWPPVWIFVCGFFLGMFPAIGSDVLNWVKLPEGEFCSSYS